MSALTRHACRDQQFAEIYHPMTGEIHGGWQESAGPIALWRSCSRQTWSATAYLRMLLMDVAGMDFTVDGIRFAPNMGEALTELRLDGIIYRGTALSLSVTGRGDCIQAFFINGEQRDKPFLPRGAFEKAEIRIEME